MFFSKAKREAKRQRTRFEQFCQQAKGHLASVGVDFEFSDDDLQLPEDILFVDLVSELWAHPMPRDRLNGTTELAQFYSVDNRFDDCLQLLEHLKARKDLAAADSIPPLQFRVRPVPIFSSPPTLKEIEHAVADGFKIHAVKAYRELNSCGLREAKDAIDAILEQPRSSTPL